MKKDRIIQYRGWNVQYSGRDHWDSFGLAGYHVYEIEPDEEALSFGDLESALNYIDDEMDDREFDDEEKPDWCSEDKHIPGCKCGIADNP